MTPEPERETMMYRIVHQTTYSYEETLTHCYNEAHLLPRSHPGQACLRSSLVVEPPPVDSTERLDFFGNRVTYFSIDQPHTTLVVTATSEVEVGPDPTALAVSRDGDPVWESVRDQLAEAVGGDLGDARAFVLDSGLVRRGKPLERYASSSLVPGRPLVEAVSDLMARMADDFTFDNQSTDVATPVLEVLGHRRGVCQDFAHLAIGFLRSHGLAARYVSGYLETVPAPGTEKLRGADASHAWVSTFVPGYGWLDFDPTNNLFPGSRHITTGWGRDYSDVTPLKGVVFTGSAAHSLYVSVDVEALG